VPWPRWECTYWIKQRIEEMTGIPIAQQRIVYGGKQPDDFFRDPGLQYGTTMHLVLRPVQATKGTR